MPATKGQNCTANPDRRITICFLIDKLDIAGTEKHLLQLIRDLDRAKFDPILVLLNGDDPISSQLEPGHCDVVQLGVRSFYHPATITKSLGFIKMLRRRRVDILQMYFPDSTIFGSVCGRLAGVPNRIRTRRNAGYWMTFSHRVRCNVINRLVTNTIANNEASRQSVIQQEKATDDSVIVIANGVDLDRYSPRDRVDNRSNGAPSRIGMLANLRPVKGIDVFIRAAARILKTRKDCLFEIAGEGPSRSDLQELIDRLGVSENVSMLGAVEDVPGYLARQELLVSCSLSEGFSNTLLEAMAVALPIVATDVEGNHSLIVNRQNGLLFPVGDVEKLTEHICNILDDESLAASLGLAGRKMVEMQFDQTKMVRQYEQTYIGLVESKTEKSSR